MLLVKYKNKFDHKTQQKQSRTISFNNVGILIFKVGCSHYILTPRGSTGSSTFLVSNESPYFSHYNPKGLASNSLYLRSSSRKCTLFWYFHNSCFTPGEKIKSDLEVKLYKMCPKRQGQSVKSEKYASQNGHILP